MSKDGVLRTWIGAVVAVLVCQSAGVIGALTTQTGLSTWYTGLEKPSFNPPGWVFGPVWTLLYTLMGIAVWRVWRRGPGVPGVRAGVVLFAVQLLLNAAWSPVFFGAERIDIALGIIAALWAVLVATTVVFFKVDRPAGWMLVPYILWVSFATVLNASLLSLNG